MTEEHRVILTILVIVFNVMPGAGFCTVLWVAYAGSRNIWAAILATCVTAFLIFEVGTLMFALWGPY